LIKYQKISQYIFHDQVPQNVPRVVCLVSVEKDGTVNFENVLKTTVGTAYGAVSTTILAAVSKL